MTISIKHCITTKHFSSSLANIFLIPDPKMYSAQSLISNTNVSSYFPHAPTIRHLHGACETVKNGKLTESRNHIPGYHRVRGGRLMTRAMANEGGSKIGKAVENKPMLDSTMQATIIISRKIRGNIIEKFEEKFESFFHIVSKGMIIELISEEVDPTTKSGKIFKATAQSTSHPSETPDSVEYTVDLNVPHDFGNPGAIILTNLFDKEFHLVEIVLHGFKGGPFHFPANSWIHSHKDSPEGRILFKNKACLPSKTPPGIKDIRGQDLSSIRGNGKGERKPHERIYDYDVYNDLGNPDKSDDLARPIIGGERPYPRRLRTGRPPTKKDPLLEAGAQNSLPFYVPRDEKFEEAKEDAMSATSMQALLQNIVPVLTAAMSRSDLPLESFADFEELFIDGVTLNSGEDEKGFTTYLSNVINKVSTAGERLLKFSHPPIVKGDRLAWLRDSEFARQTIAGVNPINIELLKEFPITSKLDPAVYGPPESAITKELIEKQLNGMSFEEAFEGKRLFILDYHDILLPYVERINSLPEKKTYASRTIFFHTLDGILMPILIELSLAPKLPHSRNKHIFIPGRDATSEWMWRLAKAHVSTNDVSIHHFVNHSFRIHGCAENYIIATHRQLSIMHPIYKLLHPHLRDTLKINATARESLLCADGIFEVNYVAARYGMEIASDCYKNTWRFDLEDLPADLLRRGMAVEDASEPSGVRLVIEDYPYAADGLLIRSAIKEMVESYVDYYYKDPTSVEDDVELQAWWNEIINKGHQDKREEPWWPKLKTNQDLSGILTSMIWMSSGHHAAINFSQYPLGSYVPYRPTIMRKLIPEEDDPQFEKFLDSPELTFFSSLPTKLQSANVMAMLETVSSHSPSEEYLIDLQKFQSFLNGDPQVIKLFDRFSSKLEEIENIISTRNKDRRLKHRCGAGVAPYEQLMPSSGPGITGRGIPNSICM